MLVLPHLVEQFGACRDPTLALQQRDQQIELLGAQCHSLHPAPDIMGVAIDLHVPEPPATGSRVGVVWLCMPAEHGSDARQQLRQREWLYHIVVGTVPES